LSRVIKLIVTIRAVIVAGLNRDFSKATDQFRMANLPIPAPLSEIDYEQIEGAVMETARGRWFLAEYARRNRNADTTMLLKALDRIEASIGGKRSVEPVDRIRFDLIEMSKAISRTKAEIASIKPDADHHGKFGEASEELDSVVQATEIATSDILACAERIQEMAWTLREQGVESEVCDLLDANATEVYTACSFQDITGQRTRKVIQVLRYLEDRINAMISIWGLDGAMAAEAAEARAVDGDKALLNGPAKPGHGMDQADVDMVMGPAAATEARQPRAVPVRAMPAREAYQAAPPLQPADEIAAPEEVHDGEIEQPAPRPQTRYPDAVTVEASAGDTAVIEEPRVEARPSEAPIVEAPRVEVKAAAVQAVQQDAQENVVVEPWAPRATGPLNDSLGPVMALSADERIALFT
jgi:chemotaxis protein CheZ